MHKRILQKQNANTLVRNNSEAEFEKNSIDAKERRQMREMKSVNKLIGTKKNHFFFEEGQKTIGCYRFDTRKQIGSGYSSKVYKAISTKDNKNYAVKVIELKNFRPSQYSMLEKEIEILKKMSDLYIVKFENVFRSSTHLYIVTEFCEKGDLLGYITRKRVLSEKQALNIFSDLVKGLQYLMKNGIIHRDIKPGNIISDGQKWKLADFGFAIQSYSDIKTKNNVGTPLYMPLQALMDNNYSPQSDIFALGIVLYELLIGSTPWESKDEAQLLQKLKKVPFKIPQSTRISQSTRELLKKLCCTEKLKRMTKKQFMLIDPNTFESFVATQSNLFKKQNPEQNGEKSLIKKQSNKPIQPIIINTTNNTVNNLQVVNLNKIPKAPINNPKIQSPRSNNKNFFLSSQLSNLQQVQKKNLNEFLKPQQKTKPQKNLLTNGKRKKSVEMTNTTIGLMDKDKSQQNTSKLIKIRSETNIALKPNNILDQLNKNKQAVQNKQGKQKGQKANKLILLSTLNFCRFMYYFMKNTEYLEINELNRYKIKIILLKHSIYVLKQLIQTKTKNNQLIYLHNYQQYRQSKTYAKMFVTFQQYLNKYQKDYDLMIINYGQSSGFQNSLKDIYQKFNEYLFDKKLQSDDFESKTHISFYQKLLTIIGSILRQNNHNLGSQIMNNKKKLGNDIVYKIQGIKKLYLYYKVIETISKQQNTYICLEKLVKDNDVLKQYEESNSTIEEFMILRKQMKYI